METYRFVGFFVGSEMAKLPRVNLGSGLTAVSIAAGQYRTCALLTNGKVKCWGLNYIEGVYFGLLGVGNLNWYYGSNNPTPQAYFAMGDNLPYVMLGTNYTVK